jgi:hypothetical protein
MVEDMAGGPQETKARWRDRHGLAVLLASLLIWATVLGLAVPLGVDRQTWFIVVVGGLVCFICVFIWVCGPIDIWTVLLENGD